MSVTDDVIQPTSDSFWEVDCYKRTVRRHEEGFKLSADLIALIQDRAHIEKEYAKSLKQWSKKWTDLIDKGFEYGTTEAACKALMQEAERVAEIHMNVKERLNNEVQNEIKHWRNETYHKSMVGQCKETKELEDGFKKAQKPWAKLYHTVLVARKQYHQAVKALQATEDHSASCGSGDTHSASSTKSGAQKPWAKRLSKVIKSKKDYHSAMKLEKTATNQENNAKNDSSMSPDQMKKLQEKAEKCRRDVVGTKEKYEDALKDINNYNAKYMEDMTEIFSKCQAAEEKRLKFFKEMLYGIHKCLDISVDPGFSQIYQQLHQSIGMADDLKDLKWWSQFHGVDMPMNWPHFEEYSPEFVEISKKKMSDGSRNTVTLQRINSRYHEEFVPDAPDEYAPDLHTISRKEKKGAGDTITLTSIKQNDTPTHAPAQQTYSSSSTTFAKTEEQTPPPTATSQISQNRPPPKPLRNQQSYDPSLNPFADDMDTEETQSLTVPNPSVSKSSSFVSVESYSECAASGVTHSDSDTNPFADDMLDREEQAQNTHDDDCDQKVSCDKSSEDKDSDKCSQVCKEDPSSSEQKDESGKEEEEAEKEESRAQSPRVGSRQARTRTRTSGKALAPRVPGGVSSAHTDHELSAYDPGLNPFGDDEEDGKDPQQSSKRNSNNGSAGDEWAEDGSGMEEVMKVPVRALYDYHGQEDDELSFKSGDVFMKLKNEDDQGWCVGEHEGTVGLYPKDYVEVI